MQTVTLGSTKGDHKNFLKLSENCRKPFFSSKQSLSSDINKFWKIWNKCKGGTTGIPKATGIPYLSSHKNMFYKV
jgi:hypothetical protein